jgi:diaminobutyrate-2-oxoglutarate transaminase
MRFALGVWVYQQSRSAEAFAFVYLAGTLPALFVMPWAGTLADHFERRWVIIGADVFAAVMAVALGALLLLNELKIPHLYLFTALGAIVASVRGPSYQAAIGSLLPTDVLTRGSGLIGFSQSILSLALPIFAGLVMSRSGMGGIVMIQVPVVIGGCFAVFAAFSHARQVLAPRPAGERPSFLRGFVGGLGPAFAFFRSEPLMMRLLIYMVLHDGVLALASGMLTPLILATHTSATVGFVTSAGTAGGLAGSLMLVIANARKRLVVWLLVCNACLSTCVIIAGLRSETWLWCVCAFIALFAGSASGGCAMALWMKKTPKETQGSVFSMLGLSQLVISSIVIMTGGFLVQRVFEPALAAGGAWQSSVGDWLGTGKGRGFGLLFVSSGTLCTGISLFWLVRSSLRGLDDVVVDLPNAVET